MAKITKVSAQKRPGRYNIFLDGKYAFSASEKTLANFRLFKDTELTAEEIEEIKQFDLDSKASDLAAKFLSYQPRTVYEVVVYLKEKDLTDEAINNAVSEFEDLGYLDDSNYCVLFIKNNLHVGKDGPKSLANKLRKKGVSDNKIEDALNEFDDEDFIEAGIRLIKSMKHQQGKLAFKELKRKSLTKLMSHGFDHNLAENIFAKLDLVEDNDYELDAIKRQGIKAYKRFKNLDETQRKYKIKNYLYTHGFSSTAIDEFLAGEIVNLSELDEY
ncbi:recombination regulator RecX [Lactobacillus psittaci]|uniref:Regulatory protein RecX n=1 Tax=Lactobacillus psittaci DSM 15354 TaxID=1122152 RepID=A0A0R1S3N3_9LACO|nr:recombination regulator RecX [Lactobacillus psittaci]KRL63846.1 regulatory protein RecX [Lactobacillus psittaci DSM 15354]